MTRLLFLAAATLAAAAPAMPARADNRVAIAQPATGSFVRGRVRITASDSAPAIAATMRFDWSSDGSTWKLIAEDIEPDDGFNAVWNTGGFSGRAIIRATNAAGNQSHVRVTVDNQAPALTVSTGPPAFSPNGDRRSDEAAIRFTAEEAVALTLQVLGPRGFVVSTEARDLPVAPRRTALFRWDGTVYDGLRRAFDGLYTVRAVAVDAAGNRSMQTAEIRVDTRPPRIKRLTASAPFGGAVEARFSLAEADTTAAIRPRLLDQYGRTIVALPARIVVPGEARVSIPLPAALQPGAYRVGIFAFDRAGNRTDKVPVTSAFLHTQPVTAHVWGNFSGVGRRVALTFDDCFDAGGWQGVLDALAREKVKATFFCPGRAVLDNTRLALRTVRDGHAIGSHGWDHADFSKLSFDSSYARLISDRNVWWELARVVPMPLFRPPYARYTPTTLAAAGAAGYSAVVLWEVDPFDWRNPGVAAIVSRVVGATTPGAIDLMHTLPATAAALPTIIRRLRARGYGFMTLPELATIGTPTAGHWKAY